MAAVVEQAQVTALRLTSGYLTAFVAAERGRATRPITIDTRAYSGSAADGQPLAEALRSPLIGALKALKQGRSFETAQRRGIDRATRQVGMHYDVAHRKALTETIESHPLFDGSARAVRGTCGACAAFSGTPHMEVHPGCQCVEMPQVAGVAQRIALPTGTALFFAKTKDEQDEMLGPDVAEKVRVGDIRVEDLAKVDRLDSDTENFITQKPLQEAAPE